MTRMVTIFVVAALFGLSLYQQGDKVKDVFEQEVSWISHTLIEEEEEEVPDAVKESLQAKAAENFLHDGVREVDEPMTVVTNAPKEPPAVPTPVGRVRRRRGRGPSLPSRSRRRRGGGAGNGDFPEDRASEGDGNPSVEYDESGDAGIELEEGSTSPESAAVPEEDLPFTADQIESIFNNFTYLVEEDVLHKLFASQSTIGETHSGSSKKGPAKVNLSDAQKELVPVDGKPERRFATCALVGNARSLLKKSHGKDIDAHDAVMRLNQATTLGFEKHVGKKTTFRLINSKWASAYTTSNKLQLEKNVTLVVSRTDWKAFLRIARNLKNKRRDVSSVLLSREAVNKAGEVLREMKRRMEGIRGSPIQEKGRRRAGG